MTETPAIGSAEYGDDFRQRIINELTTEAARHNVFAPDLGPTARSLFIQRLATAAIAVAYPEFAAWKAKGRADAIAEATATQAGPAIPPTA